MIVYLEWAPYKLVPEVQHVILDIRGDQGDAGAYCLQRDGDVRPL
jgi:hypothetical protein